MSDYSYDRRTAAKAFNPTQAIGAELSKRTEEIARLQKETNDLKTLRSEWVASPQRLVAFGIATDAQVKSWQKPIEGFQKMVTSLQVQSSDIMLIEMAAKGKHKGFGGGEMYHALKGDSLRKAWGKKLVKVVKDDLTKYRSGFTPVEITSDGKKFLKAMEAANKSPLMVNKSGYSADVKHQDGPIDWS